MSVDLARLAIATLHSEPYSHLWLDNFIKPAFAEAASDDFPVTPEAPGGPAYRAVMDALYGQEFRDLVADRFGVDLRGFGIRHTVRGYVYPHEGAIHTDNPTWQFITVNLHFNATWPHDGGRLRLLRSKDYADCALEVSPLLGSLVAFKPSEASWHGHLPFAGYNKMVQLNYVPVDARRD